VDNCEDCLEEEWSDSASIDRVLVFVVTDLLEELGVKGLV
jgi:hypothetical protein